MWGTQTIVAGIEHACRAFSLPLSESSELSIGHEVEREIKRLMKGLRGTPPKWREGAS